jgi:hypothetical protein
MFWVEVNLPMGETKWNYNYYNNTSSEDQILDLLKDHNMVFFAKTSVYLFIYKSKNMKMEKLFWTYFFHDFN